MTANPSPIAPPEKTGSGTSDSAMTLPWTGETSGSGAVVATGSAGFDVLHDRGGRRRGGKVGRWRHRVRRERCLHRVLQGVGLGAEDRLHVIADLDHTRGAERLSC